jgi:hypothetical protein
LVIILFTPFSNLINMAIGGRAVVLLLELDVVIPPPKSIPNCLDE